MQHKYISHFKIQHSDGSFEEIGGTIALAAGANVSVTAASDGISIAAGNGLKAPSSDMMEKWNEVLNGSPGGSPFTFSGTPYYLSTINGTNPIAGYYFMNVDKCYHVGTFFESTSPDPAPYTLSVLDTCPACLDCPDFDTVNNLINKLKAAIDLQKGKVEDAPTGSAPALVGGILDQYMSMVEHWNYVVNLKSWRYNAEARGNEVYASCKYTNHTDADIPAGIVMYIDFQNAPTNSKAFFIDTAVKNFSRGSCSVVRTSSSRVTLTTTAPLLKGSGIRFYCGNLSPDYVGNNVKGDAVRVDVNFNLAFPSGGIGNKATGFNTNLMVVIDPEDDEVWDVDASSSGP